MSTVAECTSTVSSTDTEQMYCTLLHFIVIVHATENQQSALLSAVYYCSDFLVECTENSVIQGTDEVQYYGTQQR